MAKAGISKEVDIIIDQYGGKITGSIGILQEIQGRYKHLPEEALRRVARKLDIPLSQVFGLATFYKAFTLKPRGRYLISVCMGTACHVKGAPRLIDILSERLKIKPGETTGDDKFTLISVNCLGCCALGPVLVINDTYYEKVTPDKVESILKEYR